MTSAITASTDAAASAGAEILTQGGNAVDAIVAAAFASCVADPCNTGIGGYGGFLTVRTPDGGSRCVDFDTWAPTAIPAKALRRRYPKTGPAVTSLPVVVAGLAKALDDLGTMTWERVVAPAVTLAGDGVEANGTTLLAFTTFKDNPVISECFDFEETSGNGGNPGLRFRQPALAATLETLAEKGPDWFYQGPLAEAARREFEGAGVETSAQEWADIPAALEIRDAPVLDLVGLRIHAAPPTVSGSPSMLATLAAAAAVAGDGALDSPAGLVRLAERMAAAWQYRFAVPGGNAIGDGDLAAWVGNALSHPFGGRPLGPGGGHTCHLNVIDGETAAALTFTHGPRWFGGAWALPGTGVLMNSGMQLFAWEDPVRRTGRNYALTNMSPTVAEGPDGALIAIGCPGARRIPSIIGLALARHCLGGWTLEEAVAGGRFHAECGREVSIEVERLDAETKAAFEARFESVAEEGSRDYYGPLTAIRREPGGGLDLVLDDRETPGFGRLLD